MGLVESDMVDRSVLPRRPAAPNNPFSSPLKDGILTPSPDDASEESDSEYRGYVGTLYKDGIFKAVMLVLKVFFL